MGPDFPSSAAQIAHSTSSSYKIRNCPKPARVAEGPTCSSLHLSGCRQQLLDSKQIISGNLRTSSQITCLASHEPAMLLFDATIQFRVSPSLRPSLCLANLGLNPQASSYPVLGHQSIHRLQILGPPKLRSFLTECAPTLVHNQVCSSLDTIIQRCMFSCPFSARCGSTYNFD